MIHAPVKNKALGKVARGARLADRKATVAVNETNNPPKSFKKSSVVLEVHDLKKSFRSGFLKRRIKGIEGVSFQVHQGQVFALIGHNGAGKTTTINCILDLIHADGGQVSIMGQDHCDPLSRSRVGYLPERPYFFEHLTGRELLKFYAQLLGLPKNRQSARIDEVLEMVGMTAFGGRRLRKYSKGMLQRMGLAQAVLGEPDLLILDEPMSGLDPLGRREIRELLMDLKKAGTTIILSSHIVPDVEMIADTVGILKGGNIVAVRELSELKQGYSYTGDLDLGGAHYDWLPANRRDLAQGLVRVEVGSMTELRELLNNCHREDIPVMSLATHRSSLEELFMEINEEASLNQGVNR